MTIADADQLETKLTSKNFDSQVLYVVASPALVHEVCRGKSGCVTVRLVPLAEECVEEHKRKQKTKAQTLES